MPNYSLKIFFSAQCSDFEKGLTSLFEALPNCACNLYCLCDDAQLEAINRACLAQQKNSKLADYQLYNTHDDVFELANHVLGNPCNNGADEFLLFWSANILPLILTIEAMLEYLSSNSEIAGVNPILLSGWRAKPGVAFMGLVADLQKQLHYLYEGMAQSNPLIDKKRFFQFAHPGCLLLRQSDFMTAGGYETRLDALAYPSLCLKIAKTKPLGFAVLPSPGILLDQFDSWNFCSLWNSFLQRGRIDTKNIKSNYHLFCLSDNLGYGCDEWLNEGPEQYPVLNPSPLLQWRIHPNPATLVQYLVSLSDAEREFAINLCRNRPASLPKTMQYYNAQAQFLENEAKMHNLAGLKENLVAWQRKKRRFHYGQLKPGIKLLEKSGIYDCPLDNCPAIFDAWIEIKESFSEMQPGACWPQIAVVMPVWNPEPQFLKDAIESVKNQTYTNWQFCIADDASTNPEVLAILRSSLCRDERIRIVFREKNGHICAATNSAIELVSAPFTAFMDNDDILARHALLEVAQKIAQQPNLVYIFSDEDHIDINNVRRSPFFKPDYLIGLTAAAHLSVYATDFLRATNGLRCGTEGSQDFDLELRVTEMINPEQIAHIPKILYHWRVHEKSTAASLQAKPYVIEATRKVLTDTAARRGFSARLVNTLQKNLFRYLYNNDKNASFTIVLLTDATPLKPELLSSLQIGDNALQMLAQPLCIDFAKPNVNAEILPCVGSNAAQAINAAAKHVAGDVALFIYGGLEPDRDCRPEQLLLHALQPHVGMVGGAIWHNNRLWHGGWYPAQTGAPFPLLRGLVKDHLATAAWGHFLLPRHVLGTSWQCFAVKRDFLQTSEFFNPEFGALAPIDYGMRQMKAGNYVVMSPLANWQLNNPSIDYTTREYDGVMRKWGCDIAANGIRNPNLHVTSNYQWTLNLKGE